MLEKTDEFFTKQAGFNRDLTFTDRGFEQILKFLGATVLPAAKDAPVNQFYDDGGGRALYNADGGLQDLGFLLGDQLLLGKESLKNWRWVSMTFSK